jgi:hypothetical protein
MSGGAVTFLIEEPAMRPAMRASLIAVALAGTAAVLNGFTTLWPPMQWAVVVLVLLSAVSTLVGLSVVQSYWREVCEALDLEEQWKRERQRCR